MTFNEFNLHPKVLDGIQAMGFDKPTPIQEQAIPVIMEGRDIIGCAQTGTGKTAAYLLPVMHRIAQLNKHDSINTIILAPTRELAQQIDQQAEGFSYFTGISTFPIYGGGQSSDWDYQKRALRKGVDMVIATPGKLMAHLNFGYVNLSHFQTLILDEADRMLDMGFIDDIMKIVKQLPEERQTLLFSATMPPKIRDLARKIMKDPAQVNIALSKPAENILQGAYLVYDEYKISLIQNLLSKKELQSVIIFASTKIAVKEVQKALVNIGIDAKAISSDFEQQEREEVLLGFRNRKYQVLVATDVLSRGIDIDGIELVLNYDVPQDAEDYVHRIGRTARAERSGLAITFINPKDMFRFHRIEKLIEREVQKLPLPDESMKGPEYRVERRGGGGGSRKKGGYRGNKQKNYKPKGKGPRNKRQD